MAPDFEYFLRFRTEASYSHTIGGMFWLDLPLALALAFVFHSFIRDPLIASLPGWFNRRFAACSDFNWYQYFKKNFFVVIICMLTGIASHLFWDAFTHESGYFVGKIGFLRTNLLLFGYPVPVYHLLQHSNSLLGALAILYAISRMPETESNGSLDFRYWSLTFLIMLLTIGIGALAGQNYWLYGHLIVTGISGGMIGMGVAGAVKQLGGK